MSWNYVKGRVLWAGVREGWRWGTSERSSGVALFVVGVGFALCIKGLIPRESVAAPAVDTATAEVVYHRCNVRATPNGVIVGKVSKGDVLEIVNETGHWFETSHGFVFDKCLRITGRP